MSPRETASSVGGDVEDGRNDEQDAIGDPKRTAEERKGPPVEHHRRQIENHVRDSEVGPKWAPELDLGDVVNPESKRGEKGAEYSSPLRLVREKITINIQGRPQRPSKREVLAVAAHGLEDLFGQGRRDGWVFAKGRFAGSGWPPGWPFRWRSTRSFRPHFPDKTSTRR